MRRRRTALWRPPPVCISKEKTQPPPPPVTAWCLFGGSFVQTFDPLGRSHFGYLIDGTTEREYFNDSFGINQYTWASYTDPTTPQDAQWWRDHFAFDAADTIEPTDPFDFFGGWESMPDLFTAGTHVLTFTCDMPPAFTLSSGCFSYKLQKTGSVWDLVENGPHGNANQLTTGYPHDVPFTI